MRAGFAPLRSTFETNSVLRNTFGLLALSMIPTALAAWFSIGSGLVGVMNAHPIMTFIGLLAVALGLMLGIYYNKDNSFGVVLMLVFASWGGVTLSTSLEAVLHLKNGGQLIVLAALGTGAILAGCSIYAMTTKRDFSGIGGYLVGACFALIAFQIIGMIFHLPQMMIMLSAVAVALFSIWLVYDVQQVVNGGETSYVTATLAIYLDLLNIFVNLLQLLAAFAGDDD